MPKRMHRRNAARAALYENAAYRALLERIAANVRRLREGRAWTQEECAFRCGDLAPTLLRRIEGAQTNVTALTLSRLAEGMQVDAGELLLEAPPLVKRKPGRPRAAKPKA